MSEQPECPFSPIGNKEFLCIEYPGIVKRTHKAIQSMGGLQTISKSYSDKEIFRVRYRPNDPFSHPVRGTTTAAAKVVVKVTRRIKKKTKEEDGPWKVELLGISRESVRFTGLCDFQRLVPEDNKFYKLVKNINNMNVDGLAKFKISTDDSDPIEQVPPPYFTINEIPQNYGYFQNANMLRVRVRNPDGTYSIQWFNRKANTGRRLTSIKYDDEVPTEPILTIRPPANILEEECDKLVVDLFKKRPCWTKGALKCQIPSQYHIPLYLCLSRHAYCFSVGPFRSVWISFGFDPRKDPENYKYQIIDAKVHHQLPRPSKAMKFDHTLSNRDKNDTVLEKPIHAPTNYIFTGENLEDHLFIYMVCDVTDPELVPIIHNPNYRKPMCDSHGGFYYRCVLDYIRLVVRSKINATRNNKIYTPMDNPDKYLEEAIEKEKFGRHPVKDEGSDQDMDDDMNEEIYDESDLEEMEALSDEEKRNNNDDDDEDDEDDEDKGDKHKDDQHKDDDKDV
ncbi:RNA polymerase III transcription factor IIIC subunit-domain-containing protein [Pilobolus umbonatus]|nr:RNA polymerase III transcription factor IIIC subunit-domain-containing protein [Pilobolus umbonatus]